MSRQALKARWNQQEQCNSQTNNNNAGENYNKIVATLVITSDQIIYNDARPEDKLAENVQPKMCRVTQLNQESGTKRQKDRKE